MAKRETSEQALSAPRGANRSRRKPLTVYRVPNGGFIVLRANSRKAVRSTEGAGKGNGVEEPGQEELGTLLNALKEANEAAERVITALDRSHEAIQSILRDSGEHGKQAA